MIRRINDNRVEVASIKVDDSTKTKEIIEHVMGTCLAPLGYYLTPLVANLNYEKKVKYGGFMSIKLFIQILSEQIKKVNNGIWLESETNGNELTIFISCSDDIYSNSTYSNREFMRNVRGCEKMIVDIKTGEIDPENYYWFSQPS